MRGYARTPRSIEGVATFAGGDQLAAFADGLDIVVSVLPLTPETTGIMNAGFFGMLADGAFIINGGRGPQVDDDDLLAALDSGKIGGAARLMCSRWSRCRRIILSGHIPRCGSGRMWRHRPMPPRRPNRWPPPSPL